MDVQEFYDTIAKSWYNIRHWTIFREELKKMSDVWSGGKLLNVGCAHGSDFIPFDSRRFKFYGIDISKELLFLAKRYSQKFGLDVELFVGDMMALPFKDNSFDYIISIATLHHLMNREERILALKEIKRVLSKEAFLTVWNRDNPELPNKEIIEREWKFGKEVLKRKYYLYTKKELEKELCEAGFEIKEMYTDKNKRNICALIRPTKSPS
ncbi:MAG: class I SAM-dependent methyltransferase [Candidatus Aenigmarchaeota archaeon]|nr:class I SAM-dependent methyltransferase [Candidatus Aenigmarchaeota archaeon]